MNLAEELRAELEIPTAFTIPIGDGIAINQTVVTTWCIIAVLFVLMLILTRGFVVHNPGKRQLLVESIVVWMQDTISSNMSEKAQAYVPYLCSVMLFLGVSNVIGVFNIAPPTKDLRTTVALALMSIVLVQVAGIPSLRDLLRLLGFQVHGPREPPGHPQEGSQGLLPARTQSS